MPEEIVATPTEPVITDDPAPVEPTVPVEPAEPVEPVEPEPPEPAFITTEQLQAELDKRDQSQRSWMGRRDKELTTQIGSVIDEKLTTLLTSERNTADYFEAIIKAGASARRANCRPNGGNIAGGRQSPLTRDRCSDLRAH